MAKNTVNKIVVTGTVRFRRHVGKVLTLTGVQHLPKLKKNLIFLGMLDSKGFGFSYSNGVPEVFKGDKVMLQ